MAPKTVQIFYIPAEAAGAAPRRAVFAALIHAIAAPLLWLAALNRRHRQKIYLSDLPPHVRRDLGFREDTGLHGAPHVRFPDWS